MITSDTFFQTINTQEHDIKILALKAYQLKLRLRNVELELQDIVGEQVYKSL